MATLSAKIDEVCNPFSDDSPRSLVNVATGKAVSETTESYLLNTLKRGQDDRNQFKQEWDISSSRFLKPVKRTKVQNFAAENVKKRVKLPASHHSKTSAESLRDMFIRMIVVIAHRTSFDLRKVLTYPIINHPLSLTHSDGTLVKTSKSALLRKLKSQQTELITEKDLPANFAEVYDGGCLSILFCLVSTWVHHMHPLHAQYYLWHVQAIRVRSIFVLTNM